MKKYSITIKSEKDNCLLIIIHDCDNIDEALNFARFEGERLFHSVICKLEVIEVMKHPMENVAEQMKNICPKAEVS